MPHSFLLLPEALAAAPFMSGSLADHWAALLPQAALPPARGSGPLVAVDGRFAALSAATLLQLAQGVADDAEQGVRLVTPDGEIVAAVHPGAADPAQGAALLTTPMERVVTLPSAEAHDASDPWGRCQAERQVVDRTLKRLAALGVRLVDPSRIWVEPSVRVAAGATLWTGAVLLGQCRIGEGAQIHAGAWLRDTEVGAGTVIKPNSVCDGAVIGQGCAVGPSAHLRPGARLSDDVKVGNFVEVKASTLHSGVRASHLSYIGDAEVGAGANVGAGTITCNYDGFGKHRTEIGAGAFIGSNTALVAPIRVGAGAIVGAGSTVTRSVPDDALAVERAEERVLEGRASRLRERNRRRAELRRDG